MTLGDHLMKKTNTRTMRSSIGLRLCVRPFSIAVSALVFACFASSVSAEAFYADQFGGRSGTPDGTGIENRELDTANAQWIIAKNTAPALTHQETVTVRNAKSAAQGMIEVQPFDTSITVRARVRPFTSDWVAIGLLSDANRPNWFSEVNQLWLYLKPSGKAFLMSHGTKSIGHRRPPPDFDSTSFHLIELTYDRVHNVVSASVDGIPVLTSVELGIFVPEISAVGFRINRDPNAMMEAGEPQLDWIEVSTD